MLRISTCTYFLCSDRGREQKKVVSNSKDNAIIEKFTVYPIQEFKKAWVIFGGTIDDFYNSTMVNFELHKKVYYLKNGMDEEGKKPNDLDLDDLVEMNRILDKKKERKNNGS